MGGVTYEILSNKGLLEDVHDIGSVRLNYQPTFFVDIDADATLFEPSHHNRLYLIDFIVRLKNDSLDVISRYSDNFHDESTINKFVEGWMDEVRLLTV